MVFSIIHDFVIVGDMRILTRETVNLELSNLVRINVKPLAMWFTLYVFV